MYGPMSFTLHKLAMIVIAPIPASSALAQTKSQSTPPSQPSEKKAQSAKDQAARDMKLCMESWDAGTHMSKAEWKTACKRTVKGKVYRPIVE